MRRRAVLATGVAAALAGCLDAVTAQPVLVRAMSAAGNETSYRCRLDASFVEAHPPLSTVLRRAARKDRGQWATEDVTVEHARSLATAIDDHCTSVGGQDGGLYRYEDRYYFISITPRQSRMHVVPR